MQVKTESEVAQSCPTLRDPMDCSLPGSSVHEILQARVLEWGAIAFSDYKHWIIINSDSDFLMIFKLSTKEFGMQNHLVTSTFFKNYISLKKY